MKPYSFCTHLLLIAASVSLLFVEAYAQTQKPMATLQEGGNKPGASNDELANELIKMESADISAIKETQTAKNGSDRQASEDAMKLWTEVKQRNTARLKTIINQHGWPGRSIVGDKGARAAFTVVQHSDHDREFQKMCLPMLKEASRKGEIEPWEVAFLTDRILVAEGKKQIYGTQFDPCDHSNGDPDSPCPIEDPDKLDLRRKEMGLPPMSEYINMMKQVRSKGRAQTQNNN